MNEDQLAELLELADGELSLPGDLEERLLTDIVETFRQAAAPAVVTDLPADHAEVFDIDLAHDEVTRSRDRKRTTWWLLGGAAAAAVVLIALVVQSGPAPVRVADSPSEPDPQPSAPAPVAPTDEAICQTLENSLTSAGLVGPVILVDDIDPSTLEQIEEASATLVERRRDTTEEQQVADIEAIETLAAAVGNLRREVTDGTNNSASAAYGPARQEGTLSTSARQRLCVGN